MVMSGGAGALATSARPSKDEVSNGYMKTEVGLVPNAWEVKPLGEIISLQRGHDLTATQRRLGNIPVMGSAGQNGFHDTALVNGPGVVLGRSGASFGQAHYCEVDFWPHNTALYVTDFRDNDSLFIHYFLKSIDFSRHNSGGAQQSLNRNFIYPIRVAVPKPPEQKIIASALKDVDQNIDCLEWLICKKRALKQGAMQELLTGKRRLSGFDGEWHVHPFGRLVRIRNEKVSTLGNPIAAYCVELEQIEQGSGTISSFSDARNRSTTKYAFFVGDVLFGRLRPYLRKFWQADRSGVCSTEIWPLIPAGSDLDSSFLRQIVQTDGFIEAASAAYGTHMPRADWKSLAGFQLLLPPTVGEQSEIARILSEMDAEIEFLELKLAKTRQIKQGMMQELLTGRVRLV